MNERMDIFDIAKAIAILSVILGHSIKDSIFKNMLYSFHLPIFFFISGYLWKDCLPKEIGKKRAKQLLKPYFYTGIFIICFSSLKELVFYNGINLKEIFLSKINSFLYSNGMDISSPFKIELVGPIWYFPALIITSIFFSYCCVKKKGIIYLSSLAIFSVISSRYIWLPWSIQVVPICAIILSFGKLSRTNNKINKLLLNTKYKSKIFIFLIWFLNTIMGGKIYISNNTYTSPILNIISIITGCFIIIWFSILIKNKSKLISRYLINIGQQTIPILCFHTIDLKLISWKKIFGTVGINGGIKYSILLIISHMVFAIGCNIIFNYIKKYRYIITY